MNPTPASHRPGPQRARSGRGNVYCIVSADGLQYLTVEEGFKPLPRRATDGEFGDQTQLPPDAWIGGYREGLRIRREILEVVEGCEGLRLAVVDLGEE